MIIELPPPSSRRPGLLPGSRAGAPPMPRPSFHGIVGQSNALDAVLSEVQLVATLDVSVLLTGPTGTGKSQLARVIHERSARSARAFVEVNCAAIPDSLFECEFFGAVQGAFTGATRRIEGKAARAHEGTLFLDEVGNLSAAAQSKLLQFLQTRTYDSLGSSTARRSDVRVIAATNVDLQSAVDAGRFREDLLFRLLGIEIRLPSLAERKGDLPLLATHFCEQACRKHKLPPLGLSPTALDLIEASAWPGNVRQLASAIEVAAIRAAGAAAPAVDAKHFSRDRSSAPAGATGGGGTFRQQTRHFQRGLVLRTLQQADWNVTQAARLLALTRTHLYNLVSVFGIDLEREGRVAGMRNLNARTNDIALG